MQHSSSKLLSVKALVNGIILSYTMAHAVSWSLGEA